MAGPSTEFETPPAETRVLRVGAPPSPPAPDSDDSSLPIVTRADLSRDDLTGLRLGPYDLGARLGAGGMGQVFEVRHRRLGKRFAVKFLASHALRNPEAEHRFLQEVTAAGRMSHPNVVNSVDAGCVGGIHYLVTEFVDGRDLACLVANSGPLPVATACEYIRQAARGLAHAHEQGLIHRDIKPSNLMLDAHGVVRLLDFGLACVAQEPHQLTQADSFLGTVDFLAPEQADDARHVDHLADLYSLGGTLLFLITGEYPFHGPGYETMLSKVRGHLIDRPPSLRQPIPGVPEQLHELINRLMAKSPSDRLASARDVAAALEPFVKSEHNSTPQTSESVAPSAVTSPRWRILGWKVIAACVAALAVAVVLPSLLKGKADYDSQNSSPAASGTHSPSRATDSATATPTEPPALATQTRPTADSEPETAATKTPELVTSDLQTATREEFRGPKSFSRSLETKSARENALHATAGTRKFEGAANPASPD
jgi:serine/threonine protein kinase